MDNKELNISEKDKISYLRISSFLAEDNKDLNIKDLQEEIWKNINKKLGLNK